MKIWPFVPLIVDSLKRMFTEHAPYPRALCQARSNEPEGRAGPEGASFLFFSQVLLVNSHMFLILLQKSV